MVKMSGQDEKLDIIDRAEKKYAALNRLLQKAENPPLPEGLSKALRDYKKLGAIFNSMAFEAALKESWAQIRVPSELRTKLERIANEKGPYLIEPNYLRYWERWNESLGL